MNIRQKTYVRNLYYGLKEPDSFGSFDRLYKRIKSDARYDIKKKELLEFMQGEEVFTSHKSKQKPKHYARVISPYPHYQIEFDSAVMPFPNKNAALKYMVIGQDTFSKMIGARSVASLGAENVNRAVNEILDELGGRYEIVRTDKGTDYLNSKVKATFHRRKIKHILGFEPNKAVYAESSIRRVKGKLYRVMQHRADHVWSNYLQDVIYSLNHTKSPLLGNISPIEVTDDKVADIWFRNMHKDLKTQPKPRDFTFQVGDSVRIHYSRGQAFRKEYNEKMGAQVYYIHERYAPGQNHLYKVRDDRNNVLPGRFRTNELEKVNIGPDTTWRIDGEPLDDRVRNGVSEVLVKWLDYDDSYNEWISEAQLEDLRANNNNDNNAQKRKGRRRRRKRR